MISIIITAFKEANTIGKAIDSFLEQDIKEDYEILVACPDEETKKVVMDYANVNPKIKHIQDPGKGKPTALNICFKEAKGDKIIMTDGDVYVSSDSVNYLINKLNSESVGAVTGRPISVNSRKNFFGYVSHLLTDVGAHNTRLKYSKQKKFFTVSGYLFAMKKLFTEIPVDALSDDAVMSHIIKNLGYRIEYEPKALVFVKFPTNFKDWINQKKRSAGGFNQLKRFFPQDKTMRSFKEEIKEGWYKPFVYPKNIKEYSWTVLLYFLRIYLWILIYRDLNLKKKSFKQIWVRVESTK